MKTINERVYRVSEIDDKTVLVRLSLNNFNFIKAMAQKENKSISLYFNILIEAEIERNE